MELEPWQKTCLKWIEESNYVYWYDRGYLQNIECNYIKCVTSLMLTNQKLHYEQQPETSLGFDSCEIINKVVPNLLAFKIVSVQPKLGPNSPLYYSKKKVAVGADIVTEIHSQDNLAIARKFKTIFQDQELGVNEISAKIINEIDYEIVTDLIKNSGTIIKVTTSVYDAIHNMQNVLFRKTLSGGKLWYVMNQETYNKYKDEIGAYGRKAVYIVPLPEMKDILMGYKGSWFEDRPYVWSPYIMLAKTPKTPDSTFRDGYLIRYGKILKDPKFYGRIVLS